MQKREETQTDKKASDKSKGKDVDLTDEDLDRLSGKRSFVTVCVDGYRPSPDKD